MKAIVVDTRNMQYTVTKKFLSFRLNYLKLEADRKIAIGLDFETEENNSFINVLRMCGFETKFPRSIITKEGSLKKTLQNEECNLLLVSELFRISNKIDHIIIMSQNKTLVPIIYLLKSMGIFIEIFGAGIPVELRKACDHWSEIKEDDLIKSNHG